MSIFSITVQVELPKDTGFSLIDAQEWIDDLIHGNGNAESDNPLIKNEVEPVATCIALADKYQKWLPAKPGALPGT